MMKKKIIVILFFIVVPLSLFGQLITGTTGTLNAPSARMQKDKTVMLGGGFLNREITPSTFGYNTFNYFLNATLLPFLEVSYSCILFKATDKFIPEKEGKFVNQDRSMSVRLRVLRERKYWPAIVVGGNDIFSSVKTFEISSGNQFFSRIFVAASKDFLLSEEKIGVDLSFIYYRQIKGRGNNISLATTYTPSFAKNLNIIAEYDSRFFNVGANYLLFNHLFLQAILQDGQYFSGGLAYKIYLK